jgi:hypothetical protein
MENPLVDTLSILACSNYRIEYILYKKGFINIGGDFIWSKKPINKKGIIKNLTNMSYENYLTTLGVNYIIYAIVYILKS